jgi:hypothetical protein
VVHRQENNEGKKKCFSHDDKVCEQRSNRKVSFFAKIILTIMMGCLLLFRMPQALAQEAAKPQSKQADISDSEIKAFAKAYVEYHQIRQRYEKSLKNAGDADKKKIEDEANAKIKTALAKQNLSPEHYNQIFKRVNEDKPLREKALKLIEEERKR